MSRSLINNLREPDEDFVLQLRMAASIVPIGFGVFLLVVMLIAMLIGKNAEAGATVSQCLFWLRRSSLYLSFTLILGSSVVLRVLYYYAKAKLKKRV